MQQLADQVFKVNCSSPRIVAVVGWMLFSPSMGKSCQVISTSGSAEVRVPENYKQLQCATTQILAMPFHRGLDELPVDARVRTEMDNGGPLLKIE